MSEHKPMPMPMAQRTVIKRKIDNASEKLRRKLDCVSVVCIAVLADGSYCHAIQGGAGHLPGPLSEFFKTMATAAAVQEDMPGFEGAVQ